MKKKNVWADLLMVMAFTGAALFFGGCSTPQRVHVKNCQYLHGTLDEHNCELIREI